MFGNKYQPVLIKTYTLFIVLLCLNITNQALAEVPVLEIKDFVEKNGYKIWVESEKDRGSTFYFTLPTK